MATIIHTIVRNDKRIYRLWNTVVDAYTTEEIHSLDELRMLMRKREVQSAVYEFEREFPGRVKRTEENGTSSRVDSRQRLDDWDDERE